MGITEIALAVFTAIGGPTTIVILYKWAKAQGRAEEVQERSKETIVALQTENEELKVENGRLWELLTRPPEKS